LQALTVGFLTVPLGLALSGGTIAFIWWSESADDGVGYMAAISLSVLGYGLTKLYRAWKYRPSDAIFDDACLRIEGGPHAKLRFAWSDLEAKSCVVIEQKNEEGKDPRWILQLDLHNLAEADDEAERDSFHEMARAVTTRLTPDAEEPEKPTQVLGCGACGAPVAPTSDDETTCAHCNAPVKYPPMCAIACARRRISRRRTSARSDSLQSFSINRVQLRRRCSCGSRSPSSAAPGR
jgi:hypothetical protein